MKVKIVSAHSCDDFEHEIEHWIKRIEGDSHMVIDIKYGGCSGFISTSYGGYYEYSAMIIYK